MQQVSLLSLIILLTSAFSGTSTAFILGGSRGGGEALGRRCVTRRAAASSPVYEKQSPLPALPEGFYDENPFDKFALALFRGLVQREIGFKSSKDGYEGLVEEARYYQLKPGVTAEDQQQMVKRVLETIAGPAVPPVYRTFMAPWPWAPFLTAFFTPFFFKFLVGPNRLDVRDDGEWGGVYTERCRFLEETNCKGLCLNMCKLPTQQFFQETLGLDVTMTPDFDTHECRLSFGLRPKPVEEDERVPKYCLSGCNAIDLMEDKKLDRGVVCSRK